MSCLETNNWRHIQFSDDDNQKIRDVKQIIIQNKYLFGQRYLFSDMIKCLISYLCKDLLLTGQLYLIVWVVNKGKNVGKINFRNPSDLCHLPGVNYQQPFMKGKNYFKLDCFTSENNNTDVVKQSIFLESSPIKWFWYARAMHRPPIPTARSW